MRQKTLLFFVICSAAATISTTRAYSSGAPTHHCLRLDPTIHHGVQGQMGPAPFEVCTDNTTLHAGGIVQVTLRVKPTYQGKAFKGFLCAAIAKGSTAPVGVMGVTGTELQTKQCDNAGPDTQVSHTSQFSGSATPKTTATFTWTAPTQASGLHQMRCVIVENKITWWNTFEHDLIVTPGATKADGTCISPPTSATLTPVSSSSSRTKADGRNSSATNAPSGCWTLAVMTTVWMFTL